MDGEIMFDSRKKFMVIAILVLITFITLTACDNNAEKMKKNSDIPVDQSSSFIMDTIVDIKVYGQKAEKVVDESFERMREIENEMSRSKESSYISKINDNAGEKAVKVDSDTFKVIKKALEYAKTTKGKFDPTIGPFVTLWGIGTKKARVPSEQEIEHTKKLVNYNWIDLNKDLKKVKLLHRGMKIDLGAIAKGYAADEVRKIMSKYEVRSAFVNLGGNVLVYRDKTDGTNWNVGIQDPREERGNVAASIEVSDKTIVTSGNYERYFKEDGRLYHHIINPDTGKPSRNNLLSVSIITKNSFDADALSTSTFILGLDKGMELVNNMDNMEAIFITKSLDVKVTSGLKGRIKILNSDFKLIEGD
jgi:thiamine biosynthesis lipoprotein